MKRNILTALAITSALLCSCGVDHLIDDRDARNQVFGDYDKLRQQYSDTRKDLFDAVNLISDPQLSEAVRFIVAYMPLNDLAITDPEYLISSAELALKTRNETAWGKTIPYDIFLHFVLPQRVNTENLDSFRISYFNELADRVAGLDAVQAALEINHWCHEKVSYQPSDSRTSAPMSTILSAQGRCGEESTLTVSALRTTGLPARQVYTPRWAHSDDNHAWVEVWIDGAWYYLGACEPEPLLDRGWFTEPARRAMLIHTKAYGKYFGPENTVRKTDLFSEINVLAKYAETKLLKVTAVDESGNTLKNADIDFLLYNYAELYPIASLKTDAEGSCSLLTGKGSLVIWASYNGSFGFTLASPDDVNVKVIIGAADLPGSLDLDLLAPEAPRPYPGLSEELAAMNNRRLRYEDSTRQAFIDSWMKDIDMNAVLTTAHSDPVMAEELLHKAMGNYRSVASFILKSQQKSDMALRLLNSVSDKDLRDTPASVFMSHLENAPDNVKGYEPEFYDEFILSPRVDNEILTPFRTELKQLLADALSEGITDDPAALASWTDGAITSDRVTNYYGTPLTPSGTARLRRADPHSRDIFYIALCRTFGHAARLEPGTRRPQYFKNGEWHDIWFTDAVKPSPEKAYVTFRSDGSSPEPAYHIHFSLSRVTDGRPKTLDFGYDVRVTDLPERIALDTGLYMLVTGNRNETGNVLAGVSFFRLNPSDIFNLVVNLRLKEHSTVTGAAIDLDREIVTTDDRRLLLSALAADGLVICWIDPDKEPTKHILTDLPAYKKEFDGWEGTFLFLCDPAKVTDSFRPSTIKGLPENSIFAWDSGLSLLSSFTVSGRSLSALPVVACTDKDGNIIYSSEGYIIGIGEQILKSIR